MDAKDISVIVPVYNGGANWVRCLEALAEAEPAPLEVIVVDDGSTDDSAEQARARGFTVLHTERARSGPAVARNLGAEHAQGAILFFVDADVVIRSDTVARVANAMNDMSASAIFGSYDDAPGDRSFLSQYKNLLHHYVHQTSREDATSFWAGCGAIRHEVFKQMGGFAVVYKQPSIEDIELGYRMRRAHHGIRLVKDLQVKHLKQWSWRSLLVTDFFNRALPWSGLILCERQLPSDLNLQPAHRLSTLVCFLLPIAPLGIFFSPWDLALLPLLVGCLVVLNYDLYHFLRVKRGLLFTVGAVPLHWFYYLYSGLAFGIAMMMTVWRYRGYVFSAPFRSSPKSNSTTGGPRRLNTEKQDLTGF